MKIPLKECLRTRCRLRAFRSAADRRIPEFAQDQIIDRLWSWLLVGAGFLIAILVFLMVYKLMPDYEMVEFVCDNNREYVDENGIVRMRLHDK